MNATLLASTTGRILPEQEKILHTLAGTEVFFAAALLVVGVLVLLFGWKAYRWVVVLNCVALGAWVGQTLGHDAQIDAVGAIVGALLLGVICWPLMKYAVALCGGLVGAVAGMALWAYFQQPNDLRWAGALTGMVLLGLLSFILFKASIILFSCLQGAAMFVLGSSALLMRYTPWQSDIEKSLTGKPILMPLLVLSVALLGLIYQHHHHGLLDSKPGGTAGTTPPKTEKK